MPVPKLGLPSAPLSASRPVATARPSSNYTGPTTTSSAGFGLLAPTDANLQDLAGGAHRDGRIRNPVPSKLKGKTDGSKGNFSVMHLDVAGRSEATERDAQAKRTSESTELAAKRAFESGYVSLRRSRFVHVPDEAAPKPVTRPAVPPSASNVVTRRLPLGPDETKSEQARLLTLLRSLHPVLVVDQICKALAFFGGIPGAPPPADGAFPQSAEANGSGSLFIGWISEIFPKLGGNSDQQSQTSIRQVDAPESGKRRRGRPKGSKATKVRKDKGIKKGSASVVTGLGQTQAASADDSWVDVDDGAVEVSDDIDANVMLLAQATSPRHTSPLQGQSESLQSAVRRQPVNEQRGEVRSSLPGVTVGTGAAPEAAPSIRKRGRPKGSKNRPKGASTTPLSARVPQLSQTPSATSTVSQPRPRGTATNPSFTAVNLATSTAVNPPGTAASEPKSAGLTTQSEPAATSTTQLSQQFHPGLQLPRSQSSRQSSQGQTVASPDQVKTSGHAGQKRKRKGAKDSESGPQSTHDEGNGPAPALHPSAHPQQSSHVPIPQPQGVAAAMPPAKRQRKTKDPNASPRKQNDSSVADAPASSSPTTAGIVSPATHSSTKPTAAPHPLRLPSPTPTGSTEPLQVSGPASAEATVSSVHSPQHNHFEVQSPTMENYEAQLQAQLEQQNDPEPQAASQQGRQNQGRLMQGQMHHQQFQQRQQQQQNPQQQNQQQGSAAPSQSPNPAPTQSTNPQATSSMVSQHTTRAAQPSYPQYRPPNAQYGQQHQQSYGSPQQQQGQQPQYSGQPAAQAAAQATQTQQQYSATTQHAFSTSQQYSSGQQQLAPQQRYQQQLSTSSPGTASYAAQHSPQFGASTSANFNSPDNSYRGSAAGLAATSYTSQRNQSGTPTTTGTYRAGSTNASHTLSHQSPSFVPSNSRQRPAGTSHTPGQGIQTMTGVQAFSGNNTDWGLFDANGLDSSGGQGALGLTGANYGVAPANVRASSNPGAAGFTTNNMAAFDTSGLSGNDRFFGMGRR